MNLRNRGIAIEQKGENTMSEIENNTVGPNDDDDGDILQKKTIAPGMQIHKL